MSFRRKGCTNIQCLWGEDTENKSGIKNNKVGMQYGELIVLEKLQDAEYLCYYSCGNYIRVHTSDLRNNLDKCKTHCGCLNQFFKKDEQYFDIIDNPKKAYILGFIISDGTIGVTKNSKRFKITVKSSDADILEKICKELSFEHPIDIKKISTKLPQGTICETENAEINICSNYLCNSLEKYGVIPKKTYTTYYPEDKIPKDFNRDFIRGLIDGDGSFGIYCDKNLNKISYDTIRLTGTISLLESISKIIKKELGIENIKVIHRKDGVIGDINFNSKKYFQKFLDYIYKDSSIFLDRKYKKYRNCLRLFDEIEKIRLNTPIAKLKEKYKKELITKIKQLSSNDYL